MNRSFAHSGRAVVASVTPSALARKRGVRLAAIHVLRQASRALVAGVARGSTALAWTAEMVRTVPKPNGPTPPRSVRIPDHIWQAAKAEAERRGETVTDAVVRFLKRYGGV